MIYREKLAKILKEKRIEKGLSQIDCAKKLGVSVITYQYWERGGCVPKEENLKRICEFFEISTDDLEESVGYMSCTM